MSSTDKTVKNTKFLKDGKTPRGGQNRVATGADVNTVDNDANNFVAPVPVYGRLAVTVNGASFESAAAWAKSVGVTPSFVRRRLRAGKTIGQIAAAVAAASAAK